MKMVYTSENRFLVNNARNIIEAEGIGTILKNEFSAGASGDIAPFDTWLELWVLNDDEYQSAFNLIERAFEQSEKSPWACTHCQEENEPAFDLCWSCQKEHTP